MKTKPKKDHIKKNRKQIRKEQRQQKKARRNEYYTQRNKPGKFVLRPASPETVESVEVLKKNKTVSFLQDTKKTVDLGAQSVAKEKRETDRLIKEMAKQRNKLMVEANREEDKNIKRLEKQLKLNKSKSRAVPKSFATDGLDYLLEVCESDNMTSIEASEQQLLENSDEFNEDFALMTNTTVNKSTEESDLEDFLNEDDGDDSDQVDMDDEFDYEPEKSNKLSAKKRKSDSISKADKNLKKSKVAVSDESDDGSYADSSSGYNDEGDSSDGSEDDSGDVMKNNTKTDDTWEDIYGRKRDKDGNVINNKLTEDKYIPPAIRARMEAGADDKKHAEKLNRLKRQLKGFLNRLAETNMHNISNQIEELYMSNSRNDMNETLTNLIFEATASNINTPERLLIEHVLLISILHANVGTEVGAHFLQNTINKFARLMDVDAEMDDKSLDNVVNVLAQLYNFKIFHSNLLYEILAKLTSKFEEKHVECILNVLRTVGFTLRKDDPLALKTLIINLQKQASSASDEVKENARVKFMLEVLLAIKNNNVNKIPNYDTSYAEHLKKLSKGFIRKGNYVTQLNIGLEDLLKADTRGKWWVVGSAWSGKIGDAEDEKKPKDVVSGFSQKLLDLARKQRMNTDTRRNIFCVLMSAEDYLDAFEKLLHLGLKNQQEREIIHVLMHCCLQEKTYNPYYSVLAQKFCDYDRRFQLTIKYSIWDKLKALTDNSSQQIANLAKLLTHLFLERGLPISTLKIVQFNDLDKVALRFIRQILLGVLLCEDLEQCVAVFDKVGQSDKLKMFRESLKLFIHHFLLKNLQANSVSDVHKNLLEERARIVDRMLSVADKKAKF